MYVIWEGPLSLRTPVYAIFMGLGTYGELENYAPAQLNVVICFFPWDLWSANLDEQPHKVDVYYLPYVAVKSGVLLEHLLGSRH